MTAERSGELSYEHMDSDCSSSMEAESSRGLCAACGCSHTPASCLAAPAASDHVGLDDDARLGNGGSCALVCEACGFVEGDVGVEGADWCEVVRDTTAERVAGDRGGLYAGGLAPELATVCVCEACPWSALCGSGCASMWVSCVPSSIRGKERRRPGAPMVCGGDMFEMLASRAY